MTGVVVAVTSAASENARAGSRLAPVTGMVATCPLAPGLPKDEQANKSPCQGALLLLGGRKTRNPMAIALAVVSVCVVTTIEKKNKKRMPKKDVTRQTKLKSVLFAVRVARFSQSLPKETKGKLP